MNEEIKKNNSKKEDENQNENNDNKSKDPLASKFKEVIKNYEQLSLPELVNKKRSFKLMHVVQQMLEIDPNKRISPEEILDIFNADIPIEMSFD